MILPNLPRSMTQNRVMDITDQIRQIAREEISLCGLVPSAADPELISVQQTVEHLNNVVTEAVIYSLHHARSTNGFPSVQLGPRTIVVDKRRLNVWVANGGLEMKV